jgi:hypothetical protein
VLLRATEFHSKQSSGNGRFIAPYQRMWDQLGDGTQAVVIGTGPGSGDRQDNEIIAETNQPAIAPVIPKLVIEYGVIAAAVFIGALLVFICARCLSPTLAACMVMFHFVLSATLLDAQQVYLVWLLVSVFARPTNEAVPVLVRFPHRIRTTAASRVSGGVAAPAGGGAG